MNRTFVWIGVLVVVAIAGAVAFFAINGDEDNRSVVADTAETPPAATSTSATPGSAAAPSLPVLPTPSLPPGSEDAETLMEINRIIFEVTQEAMKRPREDRMTAEEIDALIRSRIEELRASP